MDLNNDFIISQFRIYISMEIVIKLFNRKKQTKMHVYKKVLDEIRHFQSTVT